ncbi:MAG: M20/M25/M40 family metallo-hydrolase, partial [Candidatus Thorarchaeota archaeon]|nr:M20/M25/M40 family metallo-hydrolase [Candidatus Thorarchaeota archaeon]
KALGDLADRTLIERIPVEEGGSVFPGSSSDIDSSLVEVFLSVAKDLKGPDYELVPLMSPGGTDAKFFRQAFGTQAYGFAVHDDTLSMQTTQRLFHGDDERISIGTIDLTIKAYLEIAKRFLE